MGPWIVRAMRRSAIQPLAFQQSLDARCPAFM